MAGQCRFAEIAELADMDTGEVCLAMDFVDDAGLQVAQVVNEIELVLDGTLAVGVERGVGPGSGPSGVYVFEVAAEPGLTPLVQRYFYPASLKPIYASWATADIWRSYPDINDYLLPNVVHLVRHGDDLVAINHAGNFAVLGD